MFIRSGILRALIWGFVVGGLLAVFTDITWQTPRVPSAGSIRVETVKILPSVPTGETAAVSPAPGRTPFRADVETRETEEANNNSRRPAAVSRPKPVDSKLAVMPPREFIPHRRLNRQTDNLNVLFVGVDRQQLKMVALYSINSSNNFNSGAVFFPVHTCFGGKTLAEIYAGEGVKKIERLLEEELEIDIAYYVRMDKRVLSEVETFLAPIVVDGRQVEITNLFAMEVTPHDEEIIGELLRQLTRPSVYFVRLPQLVLAFKKYMDTDFQLTLENLILHFQIARRINTHKINKVIAGGDTKLLNGKKVLVVPDSILKNIVYQITI